FALYNQAAANAVAISEPLIQLLECFPAGADDRLRAIKELDHAGDRVTHDLIDLINRTCVTPFDRDDMVRPAGLRHDFCGNIHEQLEEAVDACENAADVLEAILVKNRLQPVNDALLVVVIVVALGFDFTNGFHDTANAVATSVSTRALTPRMAVLVASAAYLAGA